MPRGIHDRPDGGNMEFTGAHEAPCSSVSGRASDASGKALRGIAKGCSHDRSESYPPDRAPSRLSCPPGVSINLGLLRVLVCQYLPD